MLDEVDVFDVRFSGFEGGFEVVAGFNKGARIYGIPKKEEAIREMLYKNGGFILFTGGGQERELGCGKFREEFRMGGDSEFIGGRVEMNNDNVFVMGRGIEIFATDVKPEGYPVADVIHTIQGWSICVRGVVIAEFQLAKVNITS